MASEKATIFYIGRGKRGLFASARLEESGEKVYISLRSNVWTGSSQPQVGDEVKVTIYRNFSGTFAKKASPIQTDIFPDF